ncbi:hypothetical protein AHF37_12541, partial [Paragonimus kellicotti]
MFFFVLRVFVIDLLEFLRFTATCHSCPLYPFVYFLLIQLSRNDWFLL